MFPVLLNPINSFAVKFLFVLRRISTVNNLLSKTVEYSYQAANVSGSAVLLSNRLTLNRSKLVKRRTEISFSGSTEIGSETVPINALARMRHLRWAVLLFFPSRISFELFSDIFHPFRRVPSNARLPRCNGGCYERRRRFVARARTRGRSSPIRASIRFIVTRPMQTPLVPHFSLLSSFFFPFPLLFPSFQASTKIRRRREAGNLRSGNSSPCWPFYGTGERR